MNKVTSFAELKATARERLTDNYGGAIAVLILVQVVSLFASSFISSLVPVSGITGIVISEIVRFIVSTFTGLFQVGLAYYFLKLAVGKNSELMDIFYGFKEIRNQALVISLIRSLIINVCLIPYTIFYYNFLITGNFTFYICLLLSLIIGNLLSVLLTLPISQSFFLLLDFPDYTAKQALLGSLNLMKRNYIKLLLLELSFFPLVLLSMLSCGIGLLWVVPYTRTTMALYYLSLMKRDSA